MKRHHLNFKGVPFETVVAIKRYLEGLTEYIAANPADTTEVLVGALAECIVTFAGKAIESQTLEMERVRAILVEMREAIVRRQSRPELTLLDQHVLTAILTLTHDGPVSTVDLLRETCLPRSTLNASLRQLRSKDRVHREMRGTMGFWSATAKGREFAPVKNVPVAPPAGALLPIAAAHLSTTSSWHPRGRGPAKR
jgi:DNA-binding HxlR family transcriptional regulator